VDELYQAEWCPFSRRVRQRFTELGVSFITRPVPAERADREELRRRTGADEIPALVLENGSAVTGDADEIIAHLDQRYRERSNHGSISHTTLKTRRPNADAAAGRSLDQTPTLAMPTLLTINHHPVKRCQNCECSVSPADREPIRPLDPLDLIGPGSSPNRIRPGEPGSEAHSASD
jgi:glutaredoxin 3